MATSPPTYHNQNPYNAIGISGGFGTITFTSPQAAYSVKWIDNDLVTVFAAEENGVLLNLELTAERDITPLEQLRIQVLISSFTLAAAASPSGTMAYVRKHRLERHFKLSAV